MKTPPDSLLKDTGRPRKFPAGALLFSAGEPAEGFYYIESGEIRVYRMDERAREMELIRARAGDFIGEAVVFAGEIYPAFAEAVKDTETIYFGKKSIFSRIDRDPEVARFFIRLLAGKCLVLNKRVETLGFKTVKQRLIQYLLISCSGERKCEVELKMKKSDLARLIGTISETLSRTLAQMENEGLITVQGARIRIEDCARMRAVLDS